MERSEIKHHTGTNDEYLPQDLLDSGESNNSQIDAEEITLATFSIDTAEITGASFAPETEILLLRLGDLEFVLDPTSQDDLQR